MGLNGEYEPSTSDWARENAELYMSSGGTAGTELKGKPVILLTTVGAKTGKPARSSVRYIRATAAPNFSRSLTTRPRRSSVS